MDDWIEQNYQRLHDTGRSWKQIEADAARVGDPVLAAHARAQALKDRSEKPVKARTKTQERR